LISDYIGIYGGVGLESSVDLSTTTLVNQHEPGTWGDEPLEEVPTPKGGSRRGSDAASEEGLQKAFQHNLKKDGPALAEATADSPDVNQSGSGSQIYYY
jgi:hypothetical protein